MAEIVAIGTPRSRRAGGRALFADQGQELGEIIIFPGVRYGHMSEPEDPVPVNIPADQSMPVQPLADIK